MQSQQPILKQLESFVVTGFSVRTKNSDEFHEKRAKLPNLWQHFYASTFATKTPIFGVYSDYESDTQGLYTVTVGIASDEPSVQLNTVTIKTGKYLVFQNKGPMPSTVIETWKNIWDYFEANSKYHRNFISDFEAYHGPDEVNIYIGIS